MTYFLKQHFLTWGERFAVTDESARNRFFVDSELFSFGKTLFFRTLGGNDIAEIKQLVWNMKPTYRITFASGEVLKLVYSKKNGFLCKKTGIKVTGDFENHTYEIRDAEGNLLAQMGKKWFTLGDAYGIEVVNGKAENAIGVVLAVEACFDRRDNTRA